MLFCVSADSNYYCWVWHRGSGSVARKAETNENFKQHWVESVAELFVKSEKNSVADSTEEDDISDEETEPTDEKEHFEK